MMANQDSSPLADFSFFAGAVSYAKGYVSHTNFSCHIALLLLLAQEVDVRLTENFNSLTTFPTVKSQLGKV
jgi:hypothetical protein